MDNFNLLKQLLKCYAKHERKNRYQLLNGILVELYQDKIGVSENRVDWMYYHMNDCLLNHFTMYVNTAPKVWTPIFTI